MQAWHFPVIGGATLECLLYYTFMVDEIKYKKKEEVHPITKLRDYFAINATAFFVLNDCFLYAFSKAWNAKHQ